MSAGLLFFFCLLCHESLTIIVRFAPILVSVLDPASRFVAPEKGRLTALRLNKRSELKKSFAASVTSY